MQHWFIFTFLIFIKFFLTFPFSSLSVPIQLWQYVRRLYVQSRDSRGSKTQQVGKNTVLLLLCCLHIQQSYIPQQIHIICPFTLAHRSHHPLPHTSPILSIGKSGTRQTQGYGVLEDLLWGVELNKNQLHDSVSVLCFLTLNNQQSNLPAVPAHLVKIMVVAVSGCRLSLFILVAIITMVETGTQAGGAETSEYSPANHWS